MREGHDPPEREQVWEECASVRLENMASLRASSRDHGHRGYVTGSSS